MKNKRLTGNINVFFPFSVYTMFVPKGLHNIYLRIKIPAKIVK